MQVMIKKASHSTRLANALRVSAAYAVIGVASMSLSACATHSDDFLSGYHSDGVAHSGDSVE